MTYLGDTCQTNILHMDLPYLNKYCSTGWTLGEHKIITKKGKKWDFKNRNINGTLEHLYIYMNHFGINGFVFGCRGGPMPVGSPEGGSHKGGSLRVFSIDREHTWLWEPPCM